MKLSAAIRTGSESTNEWLRHVAAFLGAEAGGVLIVPPSGVPALSTHGHTSHAIEQYREYYYHLDPLPGLLAQRPDGRALVVDTTTHPAYLAQAELSANYLRPHGIEHLIATRWQETDGTTYFAGVHRFRGMAPFQPDQAREFDRLVSHWRVNRALPLPRGLDERGASSRRMSDVAAQLPIPIGVVDADLKIVWFNPAVRELAEPIWAELTSVGSGHSTCRTTKQELQVLIRHCLSQHAEYEAILARTHGRWLAQVAPLRGKPGLVLLRLSSLDGALRGARTRLERLFHLTRAEAELAVRLAQGQTLGAIASARGVSLETVRTQLRKAYQKTGTHRQAELVCLVGRISG